MTVSAPERLPQALALHRRPPASPARLVSSRWWVVPALILGVVALGLLARLDGGRLLVGVDGRTEVWAQARRGTLLNAGFRLMSFFGSTYVVLIGGAALALLAWPKCRVVSAYVVVATLVRPPFEYTLKQLADRPRPDLVRLVHGAGPSFPCGHVLAASVLWFMLPVVISLYTSSRRVWWVLVGVSVLAVFLIGCSRVYLGVHWPTDVVAGFACALLLLGALDIGFHAAHARLRCDLRRDVLLTAE